MLTLLEAKNFKCFGESGIHIDLAPLTIFVGQNGSGKSSALDAIALLAQTAEKPNQVGLPFIWKGSWLDLGDDGQYAFHKRDVGGQLTLRVGITDGQAISEWQRDRNLGQLERTPNIMEYLVQESVRTNESLHRLSTDGNVLAERKRVVSKQVFYSRQYTDEIRFPGQTLAPDLKFQPSSSASGAFSSGLFQWSSSSPRPLRPNESEEASALSQLASILLEYVSYSLANRVFLIGADRAPKKAELKAPQGNLRVGRRGEFALAVLSMIFARPEYRADAEKIRLWARVFGLEQLGGGWAGGQHLEAGYVDPKSQTALPTPYAGFGSQQLLPVLVQLFAAPQGSLIMIEEPEISLHPEAQVNLIKMFADAVRGRRQVIITTHSPTLLLALSQAQTEHGLTPEAVAIYHFSRETDESTATRLNLGENWYIRGWVPSFSKVESQLLHQWMANVRGRIEKES